MHKSECIWDVVAGAVSIMNCMRGWAWYRALHQAVGVLIDDNDARRATVLGALCRQDAHRACRRHRNMIESQLMTEVTTMSV